MTKKETILLIGGPGTGKTSLLKALAKKGFICYPEISREVILEARKQGIEQLFLSEPLLFSQKLLQARIEQFKNAQNENTTVFIDRGIPDVLAYLHYVKCDYLPEFTKACEDYKYHKIFLLPNWEQIYTSDNERYENFQQAKEIQKYLIDTYKHYGYELIEVPKATIETRIQFILSHL